jgi:hypothetical protein
LNYEQNSIELATVTVTATELKELCLNALPSLANLAMPSMSDAFKVAENAKAIWIDVEDLTKTIQIGASLSPK